MQRVPEPEELMDDQVQAQAYAEADFDEPNRRFVDLLERQAQNRRLLGRLLDLGCGPADIPLALAERHPELQIDALDGAPAMLVQARRRIDTQPECAKRIQLICDYLPSDRLASLGYDWVVSNSLLHHLADPAILWQTLRQCARPGATVLVMDLARPHSQVTLDALVETYAADAPEVLRRDFRNSLQAAYRVEEVADQLHFAGLPKLHVAMVSDRHLAVRGRLS